MICRCGYTGPAEPHPDDPHPCHGQGYTCRKPAERRFYNARPAPLPGMQFKVVVSETWACDECWATYIAAVPRPLDRMSDAQLLGWAEMIGEGRTPEEQARLETIATVLERLRARGDNTHADHIAAPPSDTGPAACLVPLARTGPERQYRCPCGDILTFGP